MIRFNDPLDGALIGADAGVPFNPAVDIAIARVTQQGNVAGGVIYTGYTEASINMHVAAFQHMWATRDLLWVVFHYPFVKLGCSKVFAQVPANNTKALELDLHLGFKEEARIADVFPAEDLIVLSMRREDCRWLSIKPRGLQE